MKRLILSSALIVYVAAGSNLVLAIDRQGKRNPFAPLDISTAPKSSRVVRQERKPLSPGEDHFPLDGILWNNTNPVAIIDGSVVKVGSEILGRKIVAISVNHVQIEYLGKKETLRMAPQILFDVTKKASDPNSLSRKGVSQ